MRKKLIISTVSFNTRKILKELLGQLLELKISGESEVWVLDNNSGDGSAEMVASEFKQIKLIASKQNGGFAKGQNQILRQTDGEYYLLLNPDTEFDNQAIVQMVEFMDQHPECGIASCKIQGTDGKVHSNGGDLPFGVALLGWLFNWESFGVKVNFHREDKEYYQYTHEVGWVGGTFMMVRAKVFSEIGYLNEDYFMYFEDTEFCYRANQAGFKILINPEVIIKHQSGASSADPRLFQWTGEMKGLIRFYLDNFGQLAGWGVKVLVYIALLLRVIAFGILGRRRVAQTCWRVMVCI